RTFLHAEGGRTLIGTDKRKLVLRRHRCQGRGSAGDRQTDRLHKEDCHRIKRGRESTLRRRLTSDSRLSTIATKLRVECLLWRNKRSSGPGFCRERWICSS